MRLRAAGHEQRRPHHGQAARARRAPEVDSVTTRLADGQPSGARGLRHVRRRLRGHPDLRRILMPEDYEGHPQRRDFPIGGEPVIFTRNEARWLERARVSPAATTEPDAVRVPPARAERHARRRSSEHGRGGAERDQRGAADAQLRPPPPGHARRAAPARDAPGRGRARHQTDHRLRAHGDREDRRGQGLLEGHPGRRADGLPLLLLQRDGLLRRRRDAARGRGPQARAVPARDPPRAQPHRLAPDLARHERAGPRRGLDLPVLPARARADPRPVRDVLRARACTRATSRSAA